MQDIGDHPMLNSPVFQTHLGCKTPDDVFAFLLRTLKDSIRGWDYFVNWAKAEANLREVEIDLNLLNYLVGKKNIRQEFARLIREHPQVIRSIPVLLACRAAELTILTDYRSGTFRYKTYDFRVQGEPSEEQIAAAVEFASETGFLQLVQTQRIRSVVDYALGVEVGLDSNGRKNRGGTAMEEIVEYYIVQICRRKGFTFVRHASAGKVKEELGRVLGVDRADRVHDFAIWTGRKLYLIEANFYGGGGSKLKSTAGEYKSVSDFLKKQGHGFVWITDGLGWKSTVRPLQETFDHIDFLLNLEMLGRGVLEEITTRNL